MLKCLCSVSLALLVSSCGVNFFKPIEGKNPALEQARLTKEKGENPEEVLKNAKAKLDTKVQDALTEIEDLITAGTSYDALDEAVIEKLRTAIPGEVKKAFEEGNLDDAGQGKIIKEYSDVMTAYSKTTAFNELNFIDILLETTGDNNSGGGNFALAGTCPDGMDVFLEVAGGLRGEFCDAEGVFDLENLRLSSFIGELLYIEKTVDGKAFQYSDLMSRIKSLGSEDTVGAIERANLSQYIVLLFFQAVYSACEFVTNDCAVDTSGASQEGVRYLWKSLEMSLVLENSLTESGLLPEFGFSAKKIVDSITEASAGIDGCAEFPGEPLLCTLLTYFQDAGANCQSIEERPGECQAVE